MEFVFIFIVIVLVLVLFFLIHENKADTKVLNTSKRIEALMILNDEMIFHGISDYFEVFKHYDNKSSYNRIEPAYLMTAEIRSNIEFFSTYANQLRENRDKYVGYQKKIQEIHQIQNSVNYSELKISESAYNRREKRLFLKRMLFPVVDCRFSVTMSYTSRKGQVNLSKGDIFNFDDLFACLESVSRSRLDKNTYSHLAAVERGEVSDSLRYDIMQRDNFTCVICGASARLGARLHVDHIVPISKGGKSIPSNLRTLCERCNIGKSDKIEFDMSTEASTTPNLDLICESCGAKLVKRSGKNGPFYGCSNFPKCRFTKSIYK